MRYGQAPVLYACGRQPTPTQSVPGVRWHETRELGAALLSQMARWRDWRPRGAALESRGMLAATHSGSFHADEVFAIAALGLVGGPVEVVRTRARDAL